MESLIAVGFGGYCAAAGPLRISGSAADQQLRPTWRI